MYDGNSVLENMHCMLISRLLRTHEFSFLLSSASQRTTHAHQQIDTRSFRDVLYSSVLATDMSLHFAWIDELKAFEREVREGGEARRDDEEARVMICQALIKCADISNPVSDVPTSRSIQLTIGRLDQSMSRRTGLRCCYRNGLSKRLWRQLCNYLFRCR